MSSELGSHPYQHHVACASGRTSVFVVSCYDESIRLDHIHILLTT